MTEWTAKLWENQPDGRVHSCSGIGDCSILGAAEALAHFSASASPPQISLDSRIELEGFHGVAGPGSVFLVRGILGYLHDQQSVLSGLDESDRQRLVALDERLKD